MIAGFTTEQIIAGFLFLIGGQEGLRWIRGQIVQWWIKRTNKITDRDTMIEEIGKAVKESMPKCEILHSGILDRIDNMEKKLSNLIVEKSENDGIKNRYNETLTNSLPFLTTDSARNFGTYKADAFFTFIMDYKDTIYNSNGDYRNAIDMINSLYLSVKCEGYNLAGKEFTDLFYNDYHKESTENYLKQLELIKDDKANGKKSRFITVSLLYLQQFLSEMIRAHDVMKAKQQWIKESSLEFSDIGGKDVSIQ